MATLASNLYCRRERICAQSGSRETFDRLASEYDELKLRVIPGYRHVRDLALRYASAHLRRRVRNLVRAGISELVAIQI